MTKWTGNRTKILILSQYFYPDFAVTGHILTELSEDLVSYGKSVKIITGFPNYAGSKHLKPPRKEKYRGIEIERVNYLRMSKDSTLGRLLGTSSFFLQALVHSLFQRNISTIFVVSNPPMLPLIGVILRKLRKWKFCFLMHDIYPDLGIKLGILEVTNLMSRILSKITITSLKKADKVIALGYDMRKILITKGANPRHTVVVPNWGDKKQISPGPRDNEFSQKHFLMDKFVLLYGGNLGLFHCLDYLILAAEKLQDFDDLLLLFVGEGAKKEELKKQAAERNLSNVKFLPYYPREKYNLVLDSAEILIVTLQREVEGISVPSKMYSYMASGKPVVGMISYKSDVGRLIEEADCGCRVDPGDVDGFCEKVQRLYNDEEERKRLGKNALKAFLTSYERKQVTRKFLDIL